MVSRRELYSDVKRRLEESGADSPEFEAKCIIEQAYGRRFPEFIMDGGLEVPEKLHDNILGMAKQRCGGFPLQYILGEWEFMGYTFKVGKGVLIPRADTETLVEQAAEICRKYKIKRIADLCSGSGCIAVSLKKMFPDSEISAVELSADACGYLRENAELNKTNINIIQADVLDEKTARLFENLDMIVSNPPYLTAEDMKNLQKEVSFEPEAALYGGGDGLDFYRIISRIWNGSIRTGGFAVFEFGMNQENEVGRILKANGYEDIGYCRDSAGIIRTAAFRKITEDFNNG